MIPWWMEDVWGVITDVPGASWDYGRAFTWENNWAETEQQWADSIGLGINGRGK